MFIAFGVSFMIWSQEYQFGTTQRMGPGYFPTVLGGLLVFLGIFAPAGLEQPVLDKLYQASVAALKSPAVVAALDKMGAKPAPLEPKAFAEYIRAEQRKYEVIVKKSGATVD